VQLDLESIHVGLIGQRELVAEPRAFDVDRVIARSDVEVVEV
jgi:hypothetical protein